jgi:hypothetical protein
MASQINLNEARIPPTSEVISGRDCGEEFRKRYQLDKVDAAPGEVQVSIPTEVVSMNTSFFLGLFGPSVKHLGREGFLAKYKFLCDDVHMETVREGISRALKDHTIFEKKNKAA